MNNALIITLILLVLLVLLYTYIGLKFSLKTRKRKGLTPYFVAGILIGIIGGFLVFYNLEITHDKVYFTIHFKRWWFITIVSIILGAVLSIYVYLKASKK
jgi:hypothetical protein